MINVEVSTVINRPVTDVFAFVSNFENHPRWEMNFQKVGVAKLWVNEILDMGLVIRE